jgi:hypothetical protein
MRVAEGAAEMLVKLTLGSLNLEYDGDETFFKDEIASFILAVAPHAGAVRGRQVEAEKTDPSANEQTSSKELPRHSTDTVAKLLNVKTGPDLIMAAVAKKILVDGDETVERSVITAEMKKASSYFKRTYQSNLSNYLDTLTKADNLRLISENVYGLPAKMRETLEPKLREQ